MRRSSRARKPDMRLNSLHAVRLFVDLADDYLGDTLGMGYDVAVQLLDRAKITAISKKALQRLVPDLDLNARYPDKHLSANEVKEALKTSEQKFFDKELFIAAVVEASESPANVLLTDRLPETKTSLKIHDEPAKERPEESMSENAAEDLSAEQIPLAVQTTTVEHPAPPSKDQRAKAVEVTEKTQQYKIDTCPSESLVIHCGDPRFQTAFKDFILNELEIRNYTPVIVGGGLHSFGVQSMRPKNFKILWEQIKFFIKEGKLHKVIFINHEDCQWYKKMRGHTQEADLPQKSKKDLAIATARILEDFTGVDVESYYAKLEGEQIVFEKVFD